MTGLRVLAWEPCSLAERNDLHHYSWHCGLCRGHGLNASRQGAAGDFDIATSRERFHIFECHLNRARLA